MAPSRSPTPPSTKRLLHELRSNAQDPNPALLHLSPVSDADLHSWTAVLKGVPDSAYENGLWLLSVSVPRTYPHAPPRITFRTQICHPNVHFETGEICLDLLKAAWTPAYTVSSALTAVHQLLVYPEVDSPLNVDVAQLLREGDAIGAEGLIRFWCRERRWDGGGGSRGKKGSGLVA